MMDKEFISEIRLTSFSVGMEAVKMDRVTRAARARARCCPTWRNTLIYLSAAYTNVYVHRAGKLARHQARLVVWASTMDETIQVSTIVYLALLCKVGLLYTVLARPGAWLCGKLQQNSNMKGLAR